MLTADSEQAEPAAFLVKDAHGCLAIHRGISQSPVSLEVLSALLKHDSVCRQTIKLLTDSGDSVATLAFKHDEPAALKLLFDTITDLGTARFLLLEHRLGDQALLDTAIAAAEAKPNHARVAVSAAHGLGLLDVSAHTARAIQRDDIHGFRLILSVDPSSTISSSLGSTSVLKAICSSQSKHINEFLTAVKDAVLSKRLDITETVAGALEFAVGHGFAQVVEALLAFPGANDACKKSDLTDDGTLLHHAVALNQHQIVKLLLPASASVANKEGYHPLHLAVMSGNVQLVDLLLERFKNVDQVGPSGQTAM
ncbi:ankyrin repeat-containing domain protein, partial [Catenaria anguillulae PL171]